MIRNAEKWEQWKREYARSRPLDVERNFRMFQAMYDHARALGVIPTSKKERMKRLEFKIRVAKDMRNAQKPPCDDREDT